MITRSDMTAHRDVSEDASEVVGFRVTRDQQPAGFNDDAAVELEVRTSDRQVHRYRLTGDQRQNLLAMLSPGELSSRECPACGGSGVASDGQTCLRCAGNGKY